MRPTFISPVFADLRGLPPLLIQAGSHEILLSDAIRLAGHAAEADVAVTLEGRLVCPTCSRPMRPCLKKATRPITRAADFLTAHLRGPIERLTPTTTLTGRRPWTSTPTLMGGTVTIQ